MLVTTSCGGHLGFCQGPMGIKVTSFNISGRIYIITSLDLPSSLQYVFYCRIIYMNFYFSQQVLQMEFSTNTSTSRYKMLLQNEYLKRDSTWYSKRTILFPEKVLFDLDFLISSVRWRTHTRLNYSYSQYTFSHGRRTSVASATSDSASSVIRCWITGLYQKLVFSS